jgi:DNA-binding NarL/FixJ family response regulator
MEQKRFHLLEKRMTGLGEIDMLKTLIVEDYAIFRQSFKERLQMLDPSMVIQEAATANEALPMIPSFSPDLIFMDVRLPDANGLELAKKIKARNPNIAIVVLTDYDLPEYREAAVQRGAKSFLNKDSFNWEEIKSLVQSISSSESRRGNRYSLAS